MWTPSARRAAAPLALLLLFACGRAGSQIRIPLTLTDPGGHSAAVACGFDGLASRCIDPALGEFELPPGGCSNPFVCAWFRDVRPDSEACLGEGLLLDLRPFGPASDTFRLALASSASPLLLRWAIPADAGFDSLRLVDLFGGAAVSIDMLAQDSVELDPSASPELFVVAWAPVQITGTSDWAPGGPAPGNGLAGHPNPFNPATTITYRLGRRERVRLAVYDLLGRRVAELADGVKEAGDHAAVWDAGDRPSGVYVCRLEAGGDGAVLRLLLVR